jgi:hypothetical protein
MAGVWQDLVSRLSGAEYRFGVIDENSPVYRVAFEPGLTNSEIADVERRFCFRFPPDLRAFLQTALPSGPRFPNWRSGDDAALQETLDAPRRGVLFDIEHNARWSDDWGPRPQLLAEALRVGAERVLGAPRLIPIFAHRYMPDDPHSCGNPVLSVYQTDVIYYGFDLTDYFHHEFDLPGRQPWPESVRAVPFWTT